MEDIIIKHIYSEGFLLEAIFLRLASWILYHNQKFKAQILLFIGLYIWTDNKNTVFLQAMP